MSAKPYTYYIGQNTEDSHQTSPAYVITVLGWTDRDTVDRKLIGKEQNVSRKSSQSLVPNTFSSSKKKNKIPLSLTTGNPLIIYSDCISLTVRDSKSQLNTQMTAVLLGGDINYSTAIAPGDIVLVNMVNWPSDAEKLVDKIKANSAINKFEDGFKGVFRVQSVRRRIIAMPDGKKQLVYNLHALGFTEFKTKIYYNPAVDEALKAGKTSMAIAAIGEHFAARLSQVLNVQDIISTLVDILMGKGRSGAFSYSNQSFQLPPGLGGLLGNSGMKFATDMFDYIFGVWTPKSSLSGNPSPEKGFNSFLTKNGHKYTTSNGQKLPGHKLIMYENWNQTEVWSILNSSLNDVLNEMYSTYRINQDGYVMPTIVARQKPFSSLNATAGSMTLSKHLEMPRWKISPSLMYDLDIGKDEAARVNLVQVFTRTIAANPLVNEAVSIAMGNVQLDNSDIMRSGLKPYVATANFDFLTAGTTATQASVWSKIVADWVMSGHLKENGTITYAGIVEPIAVGDNLEFDGVVYHIEDIIHNMALTANGNKKFTTTLRVSFGVHTDSDTHDIVFPQNDTYYRLARDERSRDYDNERIMPGVSESQDVQSRTNTEESAAPALSLGAENESDPSTQSNDGTEKNYKPLEVNSSKVTVTKSLKKR